MPSIIFDFDGTLIDSRKRLFTLFSHLIPEAKLSFDEYWSHKRKGIGHEDLLKSIQASNKVNFSSFQSTWMALIESDEYLNLDEPFPFTQSLLEKLSKQKFDLVLLTARQFPKKVHNQLEKFGCHKYFSQVLVTEQKQSKKELIRKSGPYSNNSVLIGDTGYDIATANEMSIYSIAVLSGFHSKETIVKYTPKEVIETIKMFPNTQYFNTLYAE